MGFARPQDFRFSPEVTSQPPAEVIELEEEHIKREAVRLIPDWEGRVESARQFSREKSGKLILPGLEKLADEIKSHQTEWGDFLTDPKNVAIKEKMDSLRQEIKNLQKQLTSKVGSLFSKGAKILGGLAAIGSIAAGAEAYRSVSDFKARVEDAKKDSAELQIPKIPGNFVLAGDEITQEAVDTSSLTTDLEEYAAPRYHGGMHGITRDKTNPRNDFFKQYVKFNGLTNDVLEKKYTDPLAKMTGRTPEQVEFAADVLNHGFYEGGSRTGTSLKVPRVKTQSELPEERVANAEWYDKQFQIMTEFVDHVYTTRLAKLTPEQRQELSSPLSKYISADLGVRAQQFILSKADSRSTGEVVEKLKEKIEVREAAIRKVYDVLISQDPANKPDQSRALAQSTIHDLGVARKEVLAKVSQDASRSVVIFDTPNLMGVVDGLSKDIKDEQEASMTREKIEFLKVDLELRERDKLAKN